MIKRLRLKFVVVATCVVVAVLGGIIAIINAVNYANLNADADRVLESLSEDRGAMPIPQDDPKRPDEPMQFMPPETRRAGYFTVTVSDGEIKDVNVSMIPQLNETQAESLIKNVLEKGQTDGYYDYYKIKKISDTDGDKYIFLDCSKELYSSENFLRTSIIIGLSATVLIFGLIWLFSSVAIKPIAESYSKQKRFITDANHEIKTPLAIIGATNEVMELEFGKNEWTDTINNQVKKLTALTEKLVFLSRMDEENAEIPMSEFDISQTVIEVSEPFKNLAKVSGKTFEVKIEPNLKCVGDVSLIGQLVNLLLDNAFKYSDPAGSIELDLLQSGKNCKIVVSNTTDGVDAKNLDKLFDRFYRADKSRNSETGGNGIGLSVVKSIVNIHKGKISVRSDDGKNIAFTVII